MTLILKKEQIILIMSQRVNRQHSEGGFSNRRTIQVKKGKVKRKK